MTIEQQMMPQAPMMQEPGEGIEPMTGQEPQEPAIPEPASVVPEPFEKGYAGTEDERKAATERLMELLRKYRDFRESYIEPIWNQTYRAYMGTPPGDNSPYGSYYHICEIFRQVEVLKPQLASQLIPTDKLMRYKPQSEDEAADHQAQASTHIVHHHVKKCDGETALLSWLDNVSVWGISYIMHGWASYKRVRRKIAKCVRKDGEKYKKAWNRETEDVLEEGPKLHWVNHWQIYTDARCPNLNDSPACFLIEKVTAEELKTLAREKEIDADTLKQALEDGPGDTSPGNSKYNDRPEDEREGLEDEHPNEDGLYTLITAWTNDGAVYSIINEKWMCRAQRNHRGRVPIETLRNYPQPGCHYGLGEPYMLLWDQALLDDTASQFIDGIKFALNPMFIVESAAKKKWDVMGFKPGGAVFPDKVEQIKAIQIPQVTVGLKDCMETMRRNMQLASGNTDEMQGITHHRTASGVRMLQDAASMRINHKVRWHMPVFKRLYLELYVLEARFLDEDYAVRIAGKDGKEFTTRYGPDAFEPEVDVDIELPPEFENPMEQQNRALQFYNTTVGKGDPRWKFRRSADVLVKAFEPTARTGEFYADELEDAMKAMNENDMWRTSGIMPDVRPDEPHQMHIPAHMQELRAAQALIQSGEVPAEWAHVLMNHLERHQQYMNAMQQQAAQQSQMPQGGPGAPTPGSDMRTEANFANSVTGAGQQGAMPGGQ